MTGSSRAHYVCGQAYFRDSPRSVVELRCNVHGQLQRFCWPAIAIVVWGTRASPASSGSASCEMLLAVVHDGLPAFLGCDELSIAVLRISNSNLHSVHGPMGEKRIADNFPGVDIRGQPREGMRTAYSVVSTTFLTMTGVMARYYSPDLCSRWAMANRTHADFVTEAIHAIEACTIGAPFMRLQITLHPAQWRITPL